MKFSFLISLLLALTLTASGQTPVKRWGQLQVKGTELCDEQGQPVQLRGVSIGWHNLWPRFYNKGAVKTLTRDWHATLIRAAMGVKIDDNYLENPSFALSCIEPVVEAAIRQGVYVIIDWHAHDMYTEQAKTFFGRMAQKYGKYPNVIYELYNEPMEDSWASLKAYHKTLIDEIRRWDPDNLILCGCGHWDQDIDQVAESPIEGVSNVMYTVHFYAATHGQWLRDRTEAAIRRGIPVFISECGGCEASGNGVLSEPEWDEWMALSDRYHLSWAAWSLSDKDETCSMLLPRADAKGPWTDDLIKPWGKIVKKTLAKYAF